MSLTKDISKFFEKASKKRGLRDQLKTFEHLKKMREYKSSSGGLTDMPEDVFTESLKSPECIYEQFNDLTESLNFLSDKFLGYEEDRAKKDKIIEDIKSVVDSLSTKVEKLEKL